MRGNIRKWVVLGAVAAASWLVPGCTNTHRDAEEQTPIETGTGGAGDTTGTGGAGDNVQQETGTQGQGVTGGSDEGELLNTDTESGGIRSPDMPEMNPQSGEERFKK